MKRRLVKSLSLFATAMVTAAMVTGCGSAATADNNTASDTTIEDTEVSTDSETNGENSAISQEPSGTKPEGGRGQGGGLVKEQAVDTSTITNKYLDVAYANTSESQKMDIYLPENIDESEPVPVIVYVHGGAFKMGDKGSGCIGSI